MRSWNQLWVPFIFVLLMWVCVCLITLTASTYKQLVTESAAQFESRTALSYIRNKVRQKDGLGDIAIQEKEGQQVLVIQEEQEGAVYETWIYVWAGKLCELYVSEGSQLGLSSGFELLGLEALSFEKEENGLLHIDLTTTAKETYQLDLMLRST